MKLFKQDGFPTEFGKQQLQSFENQIKKLLKSEHVRGMSNTELRILGAWLSKMIGDHVTDNIINKVNKK